MKAKTISPAQRRATSLHGLKHYRITLPPPGCREVDAGLEFQFLAVAPWLPEKYHLEAGDYELLERNGLYQGLNLDVLQGYAALYNARLGTWVSGESFFAAQESVLMDLIQCHREAVGLWNAHAALYEQHLQNFRVQCQANRHAIQDLMARLEARKRDIERLQRCMARIAGKKTDPIIDILKTSGDEPVVVLGASLADTKRDLGLLENHCKLQQIAIADAHLLLRLVERSLPLGIGDGPADDIEPQPA